MAPLDDFPVWAKSTEQVCAKYAVDPKRGLSTAEVEKRRTEYGYNELEKEPPTPLWKLVLEQFDDMLVKVSRPLLLLPIAAA